MVAAAELILKECLVRVVPGSPLEYYLGTDAAPGVRATPPQAR